MAYYVNGLRPTDKSLFAAADFGTEIHKCLECHYSGRQMPDDMVNAQAIARSYIEHYPVDDDRYMVMRTEMDIRVKVFPWLTFAMTIDKLCVDRTTDEIVIVDYKTTKNLSGLSKLLISSQFDAYMWGCAKVDRRTKRAIIDGISTKETKPEKMFKRFETSRSDWQLAEWEAQAVADCVRIKETIENGLPVTKVRSAECFKWNRECCFSGICNATSKELSDAMAKTYDRDEWKNFSIEYSEGKNT